MSHELRRRRSALPDGNADEHHPRRDLREGCIEVEEEQQKAEELAAERARYEEEQRKNDAADLVRRFKAELAGGTPQASARSTLAVFLPTPGS